MSLATALLAPFALHLPAAPDVPAKPADAVQTSAGEAVENSQASTPRATEHRDPVSLRFWPQNFVEQRFQPDVVYQVKIEQSVRIRIAPRTRQLPAPQVRPDMLVGVPQRAIGTELVERRMGKCLPISSISGVQASRGSALILYLRDRRMVRAELDRACRARDFYSGFYLSRSADGRLCVDRDTLQSRSGANCKLSRMRQLVEAGR